MCSCLELETTHVIFLGTVDQTLPRNQSNIHPIGPSNSSPDHIDICGGTLHVHEVDHSKQSHLMAFYVVLPPPRIESIKAKKYFSFRCRRIVTALSPLFGSHLQSRAPTVLGSVLSC